MAAMGTATSDWSVPRTPCHVSNAAPTPQQWLIVQASLPWAFIVVIVATMCIESSCVKSHEQLGSMVASILGGVIAAVLVLWTLLGGIYVAPLADWSCQTIRTPIVFAACIAWYGGSALVAGIVWLARRTKVRIGEKATSVAVVPCQDSAQRYRVADDVV
jgi:hypothetical protein